MRRKPSNDFTESSVRRAYCRLPFAYCLHLSPSPHHVLMVAPARTRALSLLLSACFPRSQQDRAQCPSALPASVQQQISASLLRSESPPVYLTDLSVLP